MNKENVLGINVSTLNYLDFLKTVEMDINNNVQRSIIAVNPEKILMAKKDLSFQQQLNRADYLIADGIGTVIASKLRKGNIKQRVTGIDSMEMLCSIAAKNNYKVFLFGAKPEVVIKVKYILEEKYENIRIVGHVDGFNYDNEYVLESINASQPDILFVALGSPKQEYWILENKDKLSVKVLQGVGGAFDVLSGNVKRAPLIVRKLGFEWLYRLLRQPKRILRQVKLITFIFALLKKDNMKIRNNN